MTLILAAHPEGSKRLQLRDSIALLARILSQLTPVKMSSNTSDRTDSSRDSLLDTASNRDSLLSEARTDDDKSNEAVGATTAAALLRSQACNKVLNLLQQLLNINGASKLLRSSKSEEHSSSSKSGRSQVKSNHIDNKGIPVTDMPFIPLSLQGDESTETSSDASPTPQSQYDATAMDGISDSGVSKEGKEIMKSVTRVLMAGPRTMLWFPALLRAAEVLQLLVLDTSGAEEFLTTMYSERMPLAHGTLESHILLDMLNSINSTLQPQRLKPVRALEHHPVNL